MTTTKVEMEEKVTSVGALGGSPGVPQRGEEESRIVSSHGCDLGSFNLASNKGWGIPPGSGLRGGTLNSLNNGTSGWGAPPSNSSAASATGWGAPPGSSASATSASGVSSSPPGPPGPNPAGAQGGNSAANNNHTAVSNQWASTSPNRNTSQNTNGQPTITGSQINSNPSSNATGPSSGGSMQMGNQNVMNPPNSPMNPGSSGTNLNSGNSAGSGSSCGIITNTATSSWAQAAGKSLQTPGATNNNNNNQMINSANSQGSSNPSSLTSNSANSIQGGHGGSMLPPVAQQQLQTSATTPSNSNVTSKQIEQLNNMRESLFSQDGWGGNVNQDSNWDIPGSPEPQHKELAGITGQTGAATGTNAVWKVNVNNGTELWEANLRNGGAPPPPPEKERKPWGHTPSSNIGGTWGEDDDASDSSNVWTGVPPPNSGPGPSQQQQQGAPQGNSGNPGQLQWGMNNGPQQPPQREPNNGMWPSTQQVKKENDWNGAGRGHGGHIGGGGGIGGHEQNWSDRQGSGGRMNNGSGMDPNQGMWNKPPQQPPPQGNQWSGQGPPGPGPNMGHGPNMGMGSGLGHSGHNMGMMKDKPVGSGWDDVSPPTQRRVVSNMPNYDDGTSLWGGSIPGQQQQRVMQQGRGMPNKMDGMGSGSPMWPHGGVGGGNRNGWQGPDGPQDFNAGGGGGGGGWNEEKALGNWGDPQMQQNNSWGKPKTPTNNSNSGWGEEGVVDTSSWGNPSKNSKEEIEMALRTSTINLSDAIDSLDNLGNRPPGPMDGPWGGGGPGMNPGRRGPPPDDHFDISGLGAAGGPMGMGPPPPQPRGGFPGNPGGFSGGNNSMMNSVANPSLASINSSLLQKILTQQPNQQPPFNPGRVQQPNTSPGQLRLLVQQIQMAVQAGYLSSQILQHPLPQQSLYLLNQLLQQIKIFQQLSQAQQQIGKTNSAAALQLSVQITKTKQQITNLHNQIAAQQALHAKQQHQHHIVAAAAAASNDFFKSPPILSGNGGGMMDPMMSALQGNYGSDFGLKEAGQHQQSRLNQWTSKVPSLEKDDSNSGNEFSRAPGPQSNNSSNSILKNNASLMLGQSDNTWSTARSGNDGWPTDHSSNSNSSAITNSSMNLNDDSKNSVNVTSDSWPSDLVPEFEPGKPWKGTQILKSVEDDPTITPGSVVRSPLSLAAIKDSSELFATKNVSPPTASSISSDSLSTPLSLSNNTWSFTPTSGSSNIANNLAKLNPKGAWDDMSQRNLWDYGGGSSGGVPGSRPPPGLPKKGSDFSGNGQQAQVSGASTSNANSFNYRNPGSSSWNSQGSGENFWLLLRNLTPQIDGSTLKTLCIQHGPLNKFHLYLNHGVALVKYSARGEAAKALKALNNCVLGNTTILAETASESDVHILIQGLSGSSVGNSQGAPNNSSGFSGNNSGSSSNDNPWGVLRDSSPLWTSSPWGSSGLEAPDRATPSSLNSLLPGDLLGGESA